MTGDGRDEIVACSWDGQTYVLDQEKCIVCFQLEESVMSFCSGYYTLQPGQPPVPCLVYTTFTNKVKCPATELTEPVRQVPGLPQSSLVKVLRLVFCFVQFRSSRSNAKLFTLKTFCFIFLILSCRCSVIMKQHDPSCKACSTSDTKYYTELWTESGSGQGPVTGSC